MALFAVAGGAAMPPANLDAPVWPAVKPMFYDAEGDPACHAKGAYFKGDFISAAEDRGAKSKATSFRLRRTFNLKARPVEAWLQGMGDGQATFSVNGHAAMKAQYRYHPLQAKTETADVKNLLREGENVLEVVYGYAGTFEYGVPRAFAGGVMGELFVRYADGTNERIDTDASWRSSIDGRAWTNVVASVKPPMPPRAIRFAYTDFAHPQRLVSCGLGDDTSGVVRAGMAIPLEYVFEGEAPEMAFTVTVKMVRGTALAWEDELDVGTNCVARLPEGRWRLTIPFEVPYCLRSGKYVLSLESNTLYCRDDARVRTTPEVSSPSRARTTPEVSSPSRARTTPEVSSPSRVKLECELEVQAVSIVPGPERVPVSEMRMFAGRPEIFVDGKVVPTLWGAVPPSRRPDRCPHHSDMPLTAIKVDTFYPEWHPRLGVYDFTCFDRQAEKYRRANPDAWFIWDLTVYPPEEFRRKFPGEMASDETGDTTSIGRFSWSYASKRGLDEVKEMVGKAIEYLEASPYANRILGYRVCSGVTIEWLGWDAKPGRVMDFSEPNRRAFAAYCAEKYPQLANPHVPDLAERMALDGEYDILWNRERHLNCIAYMEYNSRIIAEDVLEACGHAKATLARLGRRKIVGSYYGYTFFLNANGCDQRRGHFALEHLLERNDGRIDFIMSPQSYGQRRIGDTCGDMKPFSTLALAGVKALNEDDTRTHNRLFPQWYGFHQTMNAEQTRSVLLRNGAIALCHGTSPYYYALATGIDLSSPECGEVGRIMLRAHEYANTHAVERHAEVALVASENSVVALPLLSRRQREPTGRFVQTYNPDGSASVVPERVAPLNGEIFSACHTLFARAGAPVDYLLAEDLKHRPGDYRVYVFLNLFTYDDAARAAVQRLREAGKTILWLYAPGYLRDNTLDSMHALTGFRFARCRGPVVAGVTVKADGRYMGMPESKVGEAFCVEGADEVLGTYADGTPGLVRSGRTFFSGTWQLDLPFIRSLYAAGGVRVWCESGDPVEANDAFFTLHARTPGVKRVRLPKRVKSVVDLDTGRVVARDVDTFTFDAKLHATYFFRFGE